MKSAPAALLVIAALAAPARAQQITPGHVHYDLLYDRVSATGTVLGPGPLQEGEWARFRIRFTYSPAFATPVTWPPSILPGSSGAGTLLGFWAGTLDLRSAVIQGAGTTEGVWSGTTAGSLPIPRRCFAPFNAGNPGLGAPSLDGTWVSNIQPVQFVGHVNLVATHNNFIVWQGAWRPNAYEPRTAQFRLTLGSLGVLSYVVARDDNPSFTLPVAGTATSSYGVAEFQIVPSPPSALLALAGAIVAARRRRR